MRCRRTVERHATPPVPFKHAEAIASENIALSHPFEGRNACHVMNNLDEVLSTLRLAFEQTKAPWQVFYIADGDKRRKKSD